MISVSLETAVSVYNPIDLVEEIVQANEWAHDRARDEEMMVGSAGGWGAYGLLFVWQREINALHFTCSFEMKVPKPRRGAVYELLAAVNERMWLGHFHLPPDGHSPSFPQGVLLRGASGPRVEQLQDLVDISPRECERLSPPLPL